MLGEKYTNTTRPLNIVSGAAINQANTVRPRLMLVRLTLLRLMLVRLMLLRLTLPRLMLLRLMLLSLTLFQYYAGIQYLLGFP